MLELKGETQPLVPAPAALSAAEDESTPPAAPAVPAVPVESGDVPKEVSWAGKTERLCCVVM